VPVLINTRAPARLYLVEIRLILELGFDYPHAKARIQWAETNTIRCIFVLRTA